MTHMIPPRVRRTADRGETYPERFPRYAANSAREESMAAQGAAIWDRSAGYYDKAADNANRHKDGHAVSLYEDMADAARDAAEALRDVATASRELAEHYGLGVDPGTPGEDDLRGERG